MGFEGHGDEILRGLLCALLLFISPSLKKTKRKKRK